MNALNRVLASLFLIQQVPAMAATPVFVSSDRLTRAIVNPSQLIDSLVRETLIRHILPSPNCTDAQIEQLDPITMTPGIFLIKIVFKDLIIHESSTGTTRINCSLYSRIPSSLGETASALEVVSSSTQFTTFAPVTSFDGTARFAFGIVDDLGDFSDDNHLTQVSQVGDNFHCAKQVSSFLKRKDSCTDPLTNSTSLGVGMELGEVGSPQTRMATLKPAPSFTSNNVSEGKMIVNQFELSILTKPGSNSGASIQINSIEMIVKSLSM